MKTKGKELDVDFIGGIGTLSADEERLLSDFIAQSKLRTQEVVKSIKSKSNKALTRAAKKSQATAKGKGQKS